MTMRWIVPFKGRNNTGVYNQNFVWNDGHLYVMDNHRAAAWCWAQHVDPATSHALVHIDRHNDTLQSQLGSWLKALPNGIPATIEAYLAATYPMDFGGDGMLFRWDNYLSIYFALYARAVKHAYFATHGEGDKPNHAHVTQLDPVELLAFLTGALNQVRLPVVLNIDLDYFFGPTHDDVAERILDDDYFDQVATEIAALDRAGTFRVITIALTATDDLTAGWAPAEALATRLFNALGRNFTLP
jgi:hypothetical protein